jgi:hypothetical protein
VAKLFDGDPRTGIGFAGWVGLGAFAAMLALLVGSMVPQIIPARATQSRL